MQVFDFKEKEFLVLFFYFQGIRDYAVDSQWNSIVMPTKYINHQTDNMELLYWLTL